MSENGPPAAGRPDRRRLVGNAPAIRHGVNIGAPRLSSMLVGRNDLQPGTPHDLLEPRVPAQQGELRVDAGEDE